jgi:hypothetical protein
VTGPFNGLWYLTHFTHYHAHKTETIERYHLVLSIIMFQDKRGDDDQDLPWDPMWEYVLGEEDEMDDRDDHDRRFRYSLRDERRDSQLGGTSTAVCGTGILKTLFQRRKGTPSAIPPSNARASVREEWRWELDTSPFDLAGESSGQSNQKGFEKRLFSNKRSQESSWIKSLWRDQSVRQNFAPSFRKPS